MPTSPTWRFREMGRDEINVDPVHDEFFKAQDLADALVRESVQNSLDARRGHSTVRVRFRVGSGDAALCATTATRYRAGLDEHLTAIGAAVPRMDTAMPFLLIEDFGTRGLAGDPAVDPEIDDAAEKNDFYFFWRNVGRSSKSELDRGRWGLGKAVFSVASRVRTVFGLTLRADDSKRLLLGQSVLKTHVIDGHRYAPYGFFGHFAKDHFPLPVEDDDSIDRFVTDFGSERSEPGLSVVIPWYREDELRFEQIAESAIRQYFYPITRGDLVVSIEEGSRKETLNARTIDTLAARFSGPAADDSQQGGRPGSLASLCALTRWSVTLPDDEYVPVAEPPIASAPKWRESIWPTAIAARLQERYEAGERLAFRVRLPVKRRRSRPRSSYFDVVLEKDESLRRGEHSFIRRGITIPEVRSGREKPVRALIVVDDEALSSFLGDAENPAHSDWSERSDKIRELYEHGAFTVRYVKQSAARIIAAIARPPEGRFRDLLADIFSVDTAGSNGDGDDDANSFDPGTKGSRGRSSNDGEGARSGPGSGATPTGPPQPRPTLTPTAGGFTLHGSGEPADVGATFTAEAAYRTRHGNPFKKYSGFDFVVGAGGIALRTDGARVVSVAGNRASFVGDRPDFLVAVSGFDRRRDLVVRVTRMDEAAETEEGGD